MTKFKAKVSFAVTATDRAEFIIEAPRAHFDSTGDTFTIVAGDVRLDFPYSDFEFIPLTPQTQ